ncbi:hypothetical protein NQ317_017462, partial [Molorchus minor]
CTMNNCESKRLWSCKYCNKQFTAYEVKTLYDIAYNRSKSVYSENVLLVYFSENAKNYKSSTYGRNILWLSHLDNLRQHRYKQIPQTDRIFEKNRGRISSEKIENIDKE